jgi:hypothetical protein
MEETQEKDAPVNQYPSDTAADKKTWGIYVYFAADIHNKDMKAAVWSTLGTLASVGSNDRVKITAMIDLPDRKTEYYVIPPKPTTPGTTRWPILPDRFLRNVNSASIDAILDFFEWSNRNCPADNIALIFYGHGFALDDYDPRIQDGNAGTRTASCAKGRSASMFPGKNGNELKLLYDATYNTVLNNRDFAQAIRDYTEKFNKRKPIQVLGLDCCNMAMAEVLSELQDVAEYVVAAETELPFQSWLSAPILKKFLAGPLVSARLFAVSAVKDFINSMSRSPGAYVELSACNLEQFCSLEMAMRELVDALLPAIDKYENRSAIAQAWHSDVSFVPDGLIDLASFCDLLGKSIQRNRVITATETAVITAAKKVQAAIKGIPLDGGVGNTGGVVDLAEVAPPLAGRRIQLSTGLSIWFPPWIQYPNVRYVQIKQSQEYLFNGYSGTHFAKVTGWDRFLQKLFDLTQR